jgi:DNA polymerase I-like protein with 3'-5' exonuclease and polymerase domains
LPASASTSARRSSSATSCSARWGCPAAPRRRPASGRPPRRCSRTSPPGPPAAAQDRRLAPADQTQVDLYRRPAGLRQPETKRVHTSYALAATTTGRLSSSDPNLQNIPVRTAEGRKIRTAFIATPGNKLISADYSQIELRVLAHIADIPQLKPGFCRRRRHPRDDGVGNVRRAGRGHAVDVRRRAKAINFGIIYGISAFGLANQLSIERGRPATTSRSISSASPASATTWIRRKAFARDNGYVETIFGRRIALSGNHARPTRRCARSTNAPRSTRRSRAPPPTSSAAP